MPLPATLPWTLPLTSGLDFSLTTEGSRALENRFSRLRPSGSREQAAYEWARAYGAYARNVSAGTMVPQITGRDVSRLRDHLRVAMNKRSGSPLTWGQAWASGLSSFWGGIDFADEVDSGVVTSFPGELDLPESVERALVGRHRSPGPPAKAFATAIDQATTTIVVTTS